MLEGRKGSHRRTKCGDSQTRWLEETGNIFGCWSCCVTRNNQNATRLLLQVHGNLFGDAAIVPHKMGRIFFSSEPCLHPPIRLAPLKPPSPKFSSVTEAPGRLRQEHLEFEDSLGYKVRVLEQPGLHSEALSQKKK